MEYVSFKASTKSCVRFLLQETYSQSKLHWFSQELKGICAHLIKSLVVEIMQPRPEFTILSLKKTISK